MTSRGIKKQYGLVIAGCISQSAVLSGLILAVFMICKLQLQINADVILKKRTCCGAVSRRRFLRDCGTLATAAGAGLAFSGTAGCGRSSLRDGARVKVGVVFVTARRDLEVWPYVNFDSLLPVGYMTTSFRFDRDYTSMAIHQAKAVGNVDEPKACRTKLAAEVKGDIEKLFYEWDRFSWHRLTVYGDVREPLEELARALEMDVVREA